MSDPFAGLKRGHYAAICADPPWQFKSYTALQMANPESRRDVERHYPVLKLSDIKDLPVRELAAKDAHLFLWATGPCLRQAFEVMEAWGFRYSAIAFTWAKLRRAHKAEQLRVTPTQDSDFHVGLGLTTRKNAEFVLLGRRGNARRIAKNVRELVIAPVREHSRKPDEVYARVERYCEGPYLELFARQERPGWTSWGNEVGKFEGAAPAARQEKKAAPAQYRCPDTPDMFKEGATP